MANLNQSIRKLILALNQRGDKVLYSQKQFMGREGRPHTVHAITQAVWNADAGKYKHNEIYSSTSNIRVCLYLRDRLFMLEGKPLPEDNEMWNKLRQEIVEKENGKYGR